MDGPALAFSTTLYLLVGISLLFSDSFSQNLVLKVGLVSGSGVLAFPRDERIRVVGCTALILLFAFVAETRGASSLALGSAVYAMFVVHSLCSPQGTLLVGFIGALVLTSSSVLTAGWDAGVVRAGPSFWNLLVLLAVTARSLTLGEGNEQERSAAKAGNAAAQLALKSGERDARDAQEELTAQSKRLVRFESLGLASDRGDGTAQGLADHSKLVSATTAAPRANARLEGTEVEAACRHIQQSSRASSDVAGELLSTRDDDHSPFQVVELSRELRGLKRRLGRTLPPDVRIVLQIAEEPSTIRADRHLLDRALTNLCINALEAMPHGGTLTLGLSQKGLETLAITVADTGEGIVPHVRARVFDPFFTTKSAQRSGLGLTTAKAIVENHGGSIHLESEWGKGTIVTLSIPASTSASRPHVSGTYARVAEGLAGATPDHKTNA